LQQGDQIYGGSFSSGKIQYFYDGTQLNISSYSLLRIGQGAPEKSTFARNKISSLGYVPPKEGSKFGHLLNKGQSEIPNIAQSDIESLRRKSNLKDKIVVTGLFDKVMLYSRSFPAPFAVNLEKVWQNTALWAYLWDQNRPGSKPVWTGFSRGSFSNILIPRPGVYTLIIQSEDGYAESPGVQIAAFARNPASLDNLDLSFENNQSLTVVYQ